MELDDLLVPIASLIVGGLFILLAKPKEEIAIHIAKIGLYIAVFLSAILWIYYFAIPQDGVVKKILKSLLDLGKIFNHLILGYLLIYIFIALKFAKRVYDNDQIKRIIFFTLLGVSIATGNSFILATVGKTANFAEMTKFFTTSGYAIWFLYFIMSAETLGGLGVLLHFKSKTGPLAAAGLMLIMIGAVYTHWHNKDPFSDSYAAVSQFITLSLMQVLYSFQKTAGAKPSATPTYVV
jgi:uncharacterized membrane protein YphA (DoxX/SURF4 family)